MRGGFIVSHKKTLGLMEPDERNVIISNQRRIPKKFLRIQVKAPDQTGFVDHHLSGGESATEHNFGVAFELSEFGAEG